MTTDEVKALQDEIRALRGEMSGKYAVIGDKMHEISTRQALAEAKLEGIDEKVSGVTGGFLKAFWTIATALIGALTMWVIGGGIDGKN